MVINYVVVFFFLLFAKLEIKKKERKLQNSLLFKPENSNKRLS